MIALISPAKTLDYESKQTLKEYTLPLHLDKSGVIIKKMRSISQKKIGVLMGISENLSKLNVERYKAWDEDFNPDNARQAILAFKGDVYLGLAVEEFAKKDFVYAQDHLLILSGLHGFLRPLDLLKPYRLEMGTSIAIAKSKNLYQFWSKTVAAYINESIVGHKEETIINLASEEYFKVVERKQIASRIIDIEFKEQKGSTFKTVGFFAKKARGYMAAYIIKNKIEKSENLKQFNTAGYTFNKPLSSADNWVFTRVSE